eukprot:4010231-Alexandrium_andersonii.AAC.1
MATNVWQAWQTQLSSMMGTNHVFKNIKHTCLGLRPAQPKSSGSLVVRMMKNISPRRWCNSWQEQ